MKITMDQIMRLRAERNNRQAHELLQEFHKNIREQRQRDKKNAVNEYVRQRRAALVEHNKEICTMSSAKYLREKKPLKCNKTQDKRLLTLEIAIERLQNGQNKRLRKTD